MRKGFTVTLLAVAIAMLGYNAMAEAPVIGNIPDIIVGDAGAAGSSSSNVFVYSTDINLTSDTIVSDDVTPRTDLKWSFFEPSGKYTINGATTLGQESDAVAPAAAQTIYGTGAGNDPADTDNKIETITVRNAHLSPVTGTGATPPTAAGIIAGETATVFLFASNGDKASSPAEVVIYSDNEGQDRLSGGAVADQVYAENFATTPPSGTEAWTWDTAKLVGTATPSTNGGLCVLVPEAGDNIGQYIGPASMVQLVDNSVYQIRVKMSSTQTTVTHTPLWEVLVDNVFIDPTVPAGRTNANMYGGEMFALDNQGGATAIFNDSDKVFTFYWNPMRISVPLWRSTAAGGTFSTDADPVNDFRLRFRILDTGGFHPEFDSGTVCLAEVEVNRFEQEAFTQVGAPIVDLTNLTTANCFFRGSAVNAPNTIANGDATMTAPSGGWTGINTERFLLGSGPSAVGAPDTAANAAKFATQWVIPWHTEEIIRMEYTVSAAAAADELSQPGVFQICLDVPTLETCTASVAVSSGWKGVGMQAPKFVNGNVANADKLTVYAGTLNRTIFSAPVDANVPGSVAITPDTIGFMRPRFDMLHTTDAGSPNAAVNAAKPVAAPETGGTIIHAVKVTRVTLQ